jgi:hypothetical protein
MRSILVVSFLALVPLSASAQQADRPEDLAGWRSVKWGMTPEQAKTALGDEAEDLSEEAARSRKLVFGNGEWPVRLVIPKYELAGRDFSVNLAFDQKGGLRLVSLGLSGPLLRPMVEVEGVFETLENQLTEKYGAPSLHKMEDSGGAHVSLSKKQDAWTLSRTVISLGMLEVMGRTSLTFSYAPRNADDKL